MSERTPEDRAIALIRMARTDQRDKWPDDDDHTPLEWLAILTEEVGEVAEVVTRDLHPEQITATDRADLINELVDVAAVAVAAVEHILTRTHDR